MKVTKGNQYALTIKPARMTDGRQPSARVIVRITKASEFSCQYEVVKIESATDFGFPKGVPMVGGFAISPAALAHLNVAAA